MIVAVAVPPPVPVWVTKQLLSPATKTVAGSVYPEGMPPCMIAVAAVVHVKPVVVTPFVELALFAA
jgi:hypothetical protein